MNQLLQALLLSFSTEENSGPADALAPLTDAVDIAERAQYQQRRPVSTTPPSRSYSKAKDSL